MIERAFPDRASWLAWRRGGIGGSDVAAVLGKSRFNTALGLWCVKLGLDEDPDEPTYAQERGYAMEPMLARALQREAPVVVLPRAPGLPGVEHSAHSCLRYSPDDFGTEVRHVGSEPVPALVEYKSRHPAARTEWSEGVPEDVLLQVQHGMYVCDRPVAYVICDVVSECLWARVERDPAYETTVVPVLLDFWRRVQEEDPPLAIGEDARALARMYPRDDGVAVALPGEFIDVAEEWDVTTAARDEADEALAAMAARVKEAMKTATRGLLPDGSSWSWKTDKRGVRPLKRHAARAQQEVA